MKTVYETSHGARRPTDVREHEVVSFTEKTVTLGRGPERCTRVQWVSNWIRYWPTRKAALKYLLGGAEIGLSQAKDKQAECENAIVELRAALEAMA